ncbi:nucleotide exchange factor GrpE [bacterium]|nr:nucleotide exchange factor GrpE [bacterium]
MADDDRIDSGVPDSAFDEALKAIERAQEESRRRGKAGAKPSVKAQAPPPRSPARAADEVDIEIDADATGEDDLANLLKYFEEGGVEPVEVARPSARPPASRDADLDMLAKLLEEEQNLEKEAELLRTVLAETRASAQASAGATVQSGAALKEKETQIQGLQERLVHIQAEFDNFKKRINRDKADMVRFSNENLILSMLPIIDNFERAISHASATHDPDAMIDGVRLVLKQLHDTLSQNGVRKIDASDQQFDPVYHEAMASMETADREPGTVIAQYEPAYLLHGRLLRPAKVVVATRTNGAGPGPNADSGPDLNHQDPQTSQDR